MEITIVRKIGCKNFNNKPAEEIKQDKNNSFEFHEGLAKIKIRDKWEFINEEGEVITKRGYSFANNFKNGLAKVGNNYKYGYIDKNGNEVIKLKYQNIMSVDDFFYTDFYGHGYYQSILIDKNGKEICNAKRGKIGRFYYDRAVINSVDNSYVIDKEGNKITKEKYKYIDDYKEGFAFVKNKKNKYGFIDIEGNKITTIEYDRAFPFSDGYAVVKKGSNWIYIDKEGNEVLTTSYDEIYHFIDGLAIAKKNNKFGFINKEGKEVISLKYDLISKFDDGLALVEIDGKFGYIDKEGKEVIKPIYTSIKKCKCGYIAQKDALYGIIDKEGKEIIEFKYIEIGELNEDFLVLTQCGFGLLQGIVNSEGEIVVDCMYNTIKLKDNNIVFVEKPFSEEKILIPLSEITYDVVIKRDNSIIEKSFATSKEQNYYYNQISKEIEKENTKLQLRTERIKKELEKEDNISFENIKNKVKSI